MGKTYRKPHKLPLRKESRTRPIFGRGDDADRYFRCWNCGFVCDAQRDSLTSADESANIPYTDALELTSETDGQKRHIATLSTGHVAVRLGADGSTAKTVVHNHISDISGGCPFCGTKNWRGDY